MSVLAIDTATRVCSVALLDEEGQISEKRSAERGSHSENLFLFIEELLGTRGISVGELNAVLVSRGPGSYTGLRIGASAVKGLLFDADASLYGVDTLAGFAHAGAAERGGSGTVHAVIDARRSHMYHRKFAYTPDSLEALIQARIVPIPELEKELQRGDLLIGTGLDRLDESAAGKAVKLDHRYISAVSLLGIYRDSRYHGFLEKTNPEQFEPNYLTSGQVE